MVAGTAVPPELAKRLGAAGGAIEVAKVVCSEIEAAFGVNRCVVSYFGASGRPVIVVDNLRALSDEQRLASRFQLLLPIVEPGGVLGSIDCGREQSYPRELEHALFALGTQVSVRLAHLGVTASASASRLTRRQHEVASLASRGLTNAEIAGELGISTNTVKNRLKEVFERLGVSGRIELVHALPRTPLREALPLGVTRDGMLTITRVADGPDRVLLA